MIGAHALAIRAGVAPHVARRLAGTLARRGEAQLGPFTITERAS
jgi:hypothetical protein